MQLWIKIGAPIAVLTFVATTALMSQGHLIWAAVVVALGAATVVLTRQSLAPLEAVTAVVEGIAAGDLRQEMIREHRRDEIGRLSLATNGMIEQLRGLAEQAEDVAQGRIRVVDVEGKVLRSGRLHDADLDPREAKGDLERSFVGLTNQMRRLTIQARVISKDNLYSPLLDERVPGELGEAFALMVENLRTIADRAYYIAGGDLTSYVDGEGDLTSAFNQMVTSLNGLVQQIMETALQISTASEEILVVLQDQELSASHQASGVEETQRTMETLLSSARRIAESTQTVFKSAEKTQANNRNVADRIGELKSHTARIAEILEVIKSIADRSDLLALNASLEGLRAGEAGKGFTLVAAEMRRLAENIKDSVGDIKELVSDIGESSLASVMATEEGSRLSEQTTETALKISLITQQQQSGTEQVTQSMDELSHLINQGVAGTRQVTTAARELAASAEALQEVVDNFRVSDGSAMMMPRRMGGYAAGGGIRRKNGVSPRKESPVSGTVSQDALKTGRSQVTEKLALKEKPGAKREEKEEVPAQESPTVEFASARSGDEGLFEELARFQRKKGSADISQEFDAIARRIAGVDEEEDQKS